MGSAPLSGPGYFISLEGIEGAGKTTQARHLAERLVAGGHKVVLTLEPGGTIIGRRIRQVLLDPESSEMDFMTELLLYYADRAQHLAEIVLPSLKTGAVVITDRYSDSTLAYQGFGRGIDRGLIASLDRLATSGMKPDLTILFDLDPETGLTRNRGANKLDRLELEGLAFHRRVAEGFREIARTEPERVVTISGSGDISEVSGRIWDVVRGRLAGRGLI